MIEKYSKLVYTSTYIRIFLIVAFLLITMGIVIGQKLAWPKALIQAVTLQNDSDLLLGQWQYLPGLSKQSDGSFLIQPTSLQISDQAGQNYLPNPPINLAGTHLEKVTGDFSISTSVSPKLSLTNNLEIATASAASSAVPKNRPSRRFRNFKKPTPTPTPTPTPSSTSSATLTNQIMSIQFFGQVPIMADEFRMERESLRLTIQNSKLGVQIFNGKSQTPSLNTSFAFTSLDSNINLTMAKQGSNLLLSINGKQVGSVKDPGIFNSGNVWFGIDSKVGDWSLTSLQAKRLNGGDFVVADSSTLKIDQHAQDGLQALAAKVRPDFIVGSAQALGTLTTDPEYSQIALDSSRLGGLTPENLMKMANLQPQRGVFTFQPADALVQLAKQNGLKVHGHTLVFEEANPQWFNLLPVKTTQDKLQIENIMKDHISTVVKHFGADVNSWDVINEPIADYDSFNINKNFGLRTHKWFQAMGEDYIIKALDTAHQANPNATLFINEYGLEADGERWDAMIGLLNRLTPKLKAANIPLNQIGVGFQAHVYEPGDEIDTDILKQHIQQLEKLGFKSQISEMDVFSDDQGTQEDQYTGVFLACLAEKNCLAFRGWILSERYDVWMDTDGQIYFGEDGLFDPDMNPRPAYVSMQAAVR